MNRVVRAVVCIVAMGMAFAIASSVNAQTFSNPDPITIEDFSVADPYPSNIDVSGLVGTITGVTVTLNGFTHTFPGDVDVLLVGPDPEAQTVALMFRAGSGSVVGAVLSFRDDAASQLPQFGPIVSGTFLPSNFNNQNLDPRHRMDPMEL